MRGHVYALPSEGKATNGTTCLLMTNLLVMSIPKHFVLLDDLEKIMGSQL